MLVSAIKIIKYIENNFKSYVRHIVVWRQIQIVTYFCFVQYRLNRNSKNRHLNMRTAQNKSKRTAIGIYQMTETSTDFEKKWQIMNYLSCVYGCRKTVLLLDG